MYIFNIKGKICNNLYFFSFRRIFVKIIELEIGVFIWVLGNYKWNKYIGILIKNVKIKFKYNK